MSEKHESNLFASLVNSDLCAEWQTNLKQMLTSSLEANEKMAKAALAQYEKAMAWSKDTPWAPWCKSMMTMTEEFVEDSNGAMRSMWHIDHAREGPEKVSKV